MDKGIQQTVHCGHVPAKIEMVLPIKLFTILPENFKVNGLGITLPLFYDQEFLWKFCHNSTNYFGTEKRSADLVLSSNKSSKGGV